MKMTRKLQEGIPHQVTIRKRNGRWYASIAYWKPPMAPPDRENQSVGGAVVGITPWPLIVTELNTRIPRPTAAPYANYATGNGSGRRTPGSRGWWEAQHRLDQATAE